MRTLHGSAAPETEVPVQLTVHGGVRPDHVAYVLDKIDDLARRPQGPAQLLRVVITVEPNPAYELPARIEVSAVVAGRPIRAHAEAVDVTAAADLVVDRLRRRADRVRERTLTRHRRPRTLVTQEWRHGGLPPQFPDGAGNGPGQIVKRKTYALEPMTPERAADEMDLLDHDFFLFVDEETGADALVHRRHDHSYGVLGPTAGATGPHDCCGLPPLLTTAEAMERFAATTDRFLFYRDPTDHRARVLYHRYDGHYGLLIAS